MPSANIRSFAIVKAHRLSGMNWCLRIAAFLACVGLFETALPAGVDGAGHEDIFKLTSLSDKPLRRILQKQGVSGGYVVSLSRNSTGTKLFAVYHMPTNGNWTTVMATISTNYVRLDQVDGATGAFDDNGRNVCVVKDQELVFRDGKRVAFTPLTRWGFAPGGNIFYLSGPGKATSIFRTSNPTEPLLTLDGFYSQHLFQIGEEIFVFGYTRSKSDSKATGRRIIHEDGAYRVAEQIDLPRVGGVVDMAQDGRSVLLTSGGDLFATWSLYDLKTHKRTRLGHEKWYGFFLDPSLHDLFAK